MSFVTNSIMASVIILWVMSFVTSNIMASVIILYVMRFVTKWMGELLQSNRRRMHSGEASSSSTSQGSEYEVFLSFRGVDTRKGFTDHLYNRLCNAGIRTFRDNEGLHPGEEIGPELLEMIQQSKICIPIFSKAFASSKWCLIELTQMMKCKKDILPIFYDVSPGIVKDQLESFGEAFLQHDTDKKISKETVKGWKEALKEVGHLKGWEKDKIYDGHEAELVEKIVAEVLIKLNKISVEIPDELVGMSHHMEEMIRILDIHSEGVRIVGIHGMGGIGKTTIAKFMFNQLDRHYQPYCSFIEVTKHKDLVHLQNRLIRDILKGKDFEVETVSAGKKWIEDMLRNKKVLIVIDDVDDRSQLEAVVGEVSWFGSGSRIIVTTRDKAVLNRHKVTWVYEPERMSQDHSLQLFSLHAFDETNPPADFYELSQDIVRTGDGLPLFMEVIGRLLKGYLDDKPFWKSTSEKLKSIPNKDVLKKLKISYDTLDDEQRAIFLDIACNFIGGNRRYCVYMWDDCEFFGENGLGVLVSLSLVKIGEDNKLLMHDLVRDLGRDIVRREKEKPISRLWRREDAEETLIECKGTENVQTLSLIEPRRAVPREAFMRLSNLRYLQMTRTCLRDGLKDPLPKLRWLSLEWTRITGSSNWCLEKLVILQLLWLEFLVDDELRNLITMSTHLKVLRIESCGKLTRTPDFSSFPNLEIIYLADCPNLAEISPSVKHLNRLTSFSIIECRRVSELPKDFGPMDALTELYLHGTGVTEIPVPEGSMKKLQKLSAKGCGSLTQISSIVHLRSLQYLSFDYCKSLSEIPDSIGLLVELQHLSFQGCKSLVNLPESMGLLVNLQYLSFKRCESLVTLPNSIGSLVNLKHLLFDSCKSLVDLPDTMCSLVNLQHLSFEGCESLVRLPNLIGSLVNLKHLSFDGCKSLIDLPDSMCSLVNLQHLSFKECESLVRLPNLIGSLVNLKHLSFDDCKSLVHLHFGGCKSVVDLPDYMCSLVNLQYLSIEGYESLVRLPNSIGSLVNLKHLSFGGCKSLADLPDSMCSLVNLQHLSFKECESLVRLPNSIGSLVNLKHLSFDGCKSLLDLPDSMCSLVNLQHLSFKECKSLVDLPNSMCSLVNLQYLSIEGYESLVRLPNSIESLVNLKHLSFGSCKSLVDLPDSMCSLVNLQHLSFEGCESLVRLPNSIGSLVNLKHLSFGGFKSLVDLPDSMYSLVNLQHLSFEGCESLVRLPNSIGSLVNLKHLSFGGFKSLVDLPDSMCSLVNLQHLSFKECESLVRLPNSIGSLVNLQHLSFNDCKSLVKLPNSIGSLVNLQHLSFKGCKSLVKLPSSIGSLMKLQGLSLAFCESLVELPDSLCSLVELKHLSVIFCNSLVKLPDSIGSLKLQFLDLGGCSLLTELPESIENIVNSSCAFYSPNDLNIYQRNFSSVADWI